MVYADSVGHHHGKRQQGSRRYCRDGKRNAFQDKAAVAATKNRTRSVTLGPLRSHLDRHEQIGTVEVVGVMPGELHLQLLVQGRTPSSVTRGRSRALRVTS